MICIQVPLAEVDAMKRQGYTLVFVTRGAPPLFPERAVMWRGNG